MISFTVIILLVLAGISSGCTTSEDSVLQSSHSEYVDSSLITVTDVHGNNVNFSGSVERIICDDPHSAEILVAIGAGDLVAGVTNRIVTSQPYVMNQTPNARNIGVQGTPDVETIIEINPDVLVHSVSSPQNVDKILEANITILSLGCYDLQDMPNTTRVLGMITGKEEGAERYIEYSEKYLSLIHDRVSNISETDRPRVYLGLKNNVVFANGSRGDNLLTFINAYNVAKNVSLSAGWCTVNPEWIFTQNPDIIITTSPPSGNVSTYREYFMSTEEFSSVNAVKNQRVYELPLDLIEGPRGFIGYLYIAKAVYPERFADIDMKEILSDYADKFLPGSNERYSFYPELSVDSI